MHFLSEFAMFQKPRKGHISRHCVTTEEQARRAGAAGAGSDGEDRPRVPDSPPWEARLRPFSRPPAFPREVQVRSKTAPAGRQRHGGASVRQTAARTDLSSAACGTRHACGWHHGSGVKRDDFRRHLDTGSVRVTPTAWFRSAFCFCFCFCFCLFAFSRAPPVVYGGSQQQPRCARPSSVLLVNKQQKHTFNAHYILV